MSQRLELDKSTSFQISLNVPSQMEENVQPLKDAECPIDAPKPIENRPLSEAALMIFDHLGNIINWNEKAKELFQDPFPAHLKDMMPAPNYFLAATECSFLMDKKPQLIWQVDIKTGKDFISPARISVALEDNLRGYRAYIELVTQKSKTDSKFNLFNSCVIRYSSQWEILSAEGTQNVLGFQPNEIIGKQGEALFYPNEDIPTVQELFRSKKSILKHQTKEHTFIWVKIFGVKEMDKTYQFILRRMNMPVIQYSRTNRDIFFSSFLEEMQEHMSKLIRERLSIVANQCPPHKKMKIAEDGNVDELMIELNSIIQTLKCGHPKLPSYSILIVDDLQINQMVIEKMLLGLNQRIVKVASNGKEALDYLLEAGSLPDLVITDKNMPVMDGIALMQHIRSSSKLAELPCFLWTDNMIDKKNYETLRIEAFLAKPARKEDVIKTLIRFALKKGDLASGKFYH